MDRLWSKPFFLMTIGMLFLFTSFYLLVPTLPLFIKQLGGSESQIGLAMGMFTLSAVIFRPIVGGLLDRYGRRPFIVWVLRNYSFNGLFLIGTILSAAAMLLAFTTKTPFQPKAAAGRIDFIEKSVLSIMAVIFFMAVAYGGIITFLPLFAESVKVNPGTFFLVYAATLTVIRPITGKLSDRYGEVFMVVPALAVTIAALLVLSLSNGLYGMIASSVLFGIGIGSAQPALQSATLSLAHPNRAGAANASFMTAFDLGIGLGAIMLGWVSQYTGYQVLFLVAAASVAISLLIFTVFVSRLLRYRTAN
ncbi:MFS transporter [Paenibacillus sp. V4I7]|uniref:MFS transporter n=1 Tax=Paenibacillus sp. V4I7 TaxID=3042307 RepID=UPI00277D1958|nr:MFS transporter [Paenibacillus sp. V4I7]MDQ0897507.1 MFS family permease [Paenibacillus sp. V4I7]